jgi:hypothetical protein
MNTPSASLVWPSHTRSSPQDEITKVPVDVTDFCCGRRNCPVLTRYNDGSLLFEDNGQHIEFTPEQANRLREILRQP